MVADVLTRMLIKVASEDLIRGMCHDVCPREIISLQYVDDTIMFVDSDPKMAINLKWILTCFQQVPGMKINYYKVS